MKLLIVDDEKLTREGLVASINWKSLEISQVFQADDGLNGLALAKKEQPEIILCDVRMPRMDGIQMAERIEAFAPDTVIIFMSGYSDKEYLKAAIKLKAVNYVEKPLNPHEIGDSILEAKRRFQQQMRFRKNEAFLSSNTASAMALALTRPYREQKDHILALAQDLSFRFAPGDSFTAYMVCLKEPELESGRIETIRLLLEEFLSRYHLQAFYTFKHDKYHVFQIWGRNEPSQTALSDVDHFLAEQFMPSGKFLAARGETVYGISHAYQSFASAAAVMQSAFFFDCGQVILPEKTHTEISHADPSVFGKALADKDKNACVDILEQIFSCFYQKQDIFSHQAKDLYYKLFMLLQENGAKMIASSAQSPLEAPQSIMAFLEGCFTLQELHQAVVSSTETLFEKLENQNVENPTIAFIKDYISRNYSNEELSVREIGEHAFLSASYVCTYFKNETGQTLNQYLTAYRIEKAKQLLQDPRYQISDISARVGYSNGNYFSKSFKKLVGLSPSEYREKMLQ